LRAAAQVLGISQLKVGAREIRARGFSMERLMTFLTALDPGVAIVIRRKPCSRQTARIRVAAAE
jgi:hypothetical protein